MHIGQVEGIWGIWASGGRFWGGLAGSESLWRLPGADRSCSGGTLAAGTAERRAEGPERSGTRRQRAGGTAEAQRRVPTN